MPIARDITIASALLVGAGLLIFTVFRTPSGAATETAVAEVPVSADAPMPMPPEHATLPPDTRLPPRGGESVVPAGPALPAPDISLAAPPLPQPVQPQPVQPQPVQPLPPVGPAPASGYNPLLAHLPAAPLTPVRSSEPTAPVTVEHGGSSPVAAAPNERSSVGGQTHTVTSGEMLGDIAQRYYGSSKRWREIADANQIRDARDLRVGQKLVIPAATADANATRPASSPNTIRAQSTPAAPRYGAPPRPPRRRSDGTYTLSSFQNPLGRSSATTTRRSSSPGPVRSPAPAASSGERLVAPAPMPVPAPAPVPGPVAVSGETIHVVKSGETLQDISSRYYRTTRKWPQIRDANPGINVNNLRVGTRLRIPDAVAGNTGGAGAAASAPGVAGTDPVAPAPPLFLPAPDLMPPPPPVSQPPLEAPSRLPGLDEPGFGGGQPPPPPPPPGFGG